MPRYAVILDDDWHAVQNSVVLAVQVTPTPPAPGTTITYNPVNSKIRINVGLKELTGLYSVQVDILTSPPVYIAPAHVYEVTP